MTYRHDPDSAIADPGRGHRPEPGRWRRAVRRLMARWRRA